MRTAYSGFLRAEWSAPERRWHIYQGPVLLGKVPGRREHAVYYMRAMQGLPATAPSMRAVVSRLLPDPGPRSNAWPQSRRAGQAAPGSDTAEASKRT